MFRWDAKHTVTFSAFAEDLPLAGIRMLIDRALNRLDPFEDGTPLGLLPNRVQMSSYGQLRTVENVRTRDASNTGSDSRRDKPTMYFLTIEVEGAAIVKRAPFDDYAQAIEACGEYYEPRFPGSVLTFSTVVVGKKFMRAYASLTRLDDLAEAVDRSSPQADRAVKDGNAFIYPKSCRCLIESELGVLDLESMRDEDAKEAAEEACRLH